VRSARGGSNTNTCPLLSCESSHVRPTLDEVPHLSVGQELVVQRMDHNTLTDDRSSLRVEDLRSPLARTGVKWVTCANTTERCRMFMWVRNVAVHCCGQFSAIGATSVVFQQLLCT